jgi:hypothetical protein
MSGFWLAGAMMGDAINDMTHTSGGRGDQQGSNTVSQIRELEHQVQRLALMNQALWELLRDRAKLTDADLEAKAQEVDMRDGKADGKITHGPLRCPSCSRVSNSKHWKCMYCGEEFAKPAMG